MLSLRLFLADDHEIVRYGLRNLLESQFGWTVVGEAADGREAVEKVLLLEPDVTLLDISMPELNGLEAARQILKRGCRTKILMLSVHDAPEVIRGVLDSGAKGYRSEEHTSELQSQSNLVCRLLLEKKKKKVLRVASLATTSRGTSSRASSL